MPITATTALSDASLVAARPPMSGLPPSSSAASSSRQPGIGVGVVGLLDGQVDRVADADADGGRSAQQGDDHADLGHLPIVAAALLLVAAAGGEGERPPPSPG